MRSFEIFMRESKIAPTLNISVVCVNCRVLQHCMYTATHKKKIAAVQVLPGFEPGLLDSKSRVITNYTIEPVLLCAYYFSAKQQKIIVVSPTGFEPAILRFVVSRLIRWATGTDLCDSKIIFHAHIFNRVENIAAAQT